jgi:predicted amidophosphoribosyltransferase
VELEFAQKSCGCRSRLKALSRLRSAVAYEGPIELAIRRFKYEGWRQLATPLVLLLAERLVVEGLAGSWALAVPLHRDRLKQRGFNQAELLARELRGRLAPTRRLGPWSASGASRPRSAMTACGARRTSAARLSGKEQIWPESLSCCSTTSRRPAPRWRLARWRSGNLDRAP